VRLPIVLGGHLLEISLPSIKFCMSLSVTVERVGPDCWFSYHATISGEETHDRSLSGIPCWVVGSPSLSSSGIVRRMVVLTTLGSPGVEGSP
jgi:hypothetical protein